jgi:hypothetical protein
MRKLLVALLFIYMSPALAGWVVGVDQKHLVPSGLVSIEYSEHRGDGDETFRGAVDALAQSGKIQRLEVIALHWLVQDASFQKELISALQKSAPRELAEAARSSGNVHNPKMIQLRRPFEAAVLTTPTVKSINADLSGYGLHVSGVSTEKLSLVDIDDRRDFMCFLWLEVSALRPNNSFKPKPPRHGAAWLGHQAAEMASIAPMEINQ